MLVRMPTPHNKAFCHNLAVSKTIELGPKNILVTRVKLCVYARHLASTPPKGSVRKCTGYSCVICYFHWYACYDHVNVGLISLQ